MPRVIKHPEVRREELLDCAMALFAARGYDHASLNDLIAEAGISKGAFYYYFRSKEELVAALAARTANDSLTALQPVLRATAPNALARLNAFLTEANRNKLEMAPRAWSAFGALFRPENRVLYEQIIAQSEATFQPVLAAIIRRGVEEGVFATFDPDGVAQLLQHLVFGTAPLVARALDAADDAERRAVRRAFEKRLRLYGVAIDRLLGLADGSVHLVERGYAKKLLATLPPPRARRARAKPRSAG